MPAKPFTPTDNEAFNQAVAAANKFSDEGVQVSKDDQLRLYGACLPSRGALPCLDSLIVILVMS